jgi:glutathione S-transferase
MKLLNTKMSPYGSRVAIYLAEKGIELEQVEVDLLAGENKSDTFLRKNPAGKVPVLELDDGSFLPESGAIIEYFEEAFPGTSLLGDTPEQRAQTRATDRVASEIFTVLGQIGLHTSPEVLKIHPEVIQYPDVGKALRPFLDQLLDQLEARIGGSDFLAGPRVTIADCTFYAIMDAAYRGAGYELPSRYPRLRDWFSRFKTRPSVTGG